MARVYPVGNDLSNYLKSLAVFNPAKFATAMSLIKPDDKAAAAATEWEERTCWFPFLSSGIVTERFFDPPGPSQRARQTRTMGGYRSLRLRCGILSLTSIHVGYTNAFAGTLLTEHSDFELTDSLGNYDAPERGRPYARVEFASPMYGLPRSIRMNAEFGFCRELRSNDYDAILQYGAYLCVAQIRLNITRGLFSYKDLNTEIRYGAASNVPLAREEKLWKSEFVSHAVRAQRPVVH